MWPVWLIAVVAASSAVALISTGIVIVFAVERKRNRALAGKENELDRNLSQYHRPHLSINDVDFAALPRPGRSLRQSWQTPRRDSRFYSTMPSEDEIHSFPDGSAESVAEVSYVHTGADRSHRWLGIDKKKDKRKKKSIKLSISAPMAKTPAPAVVGSVEDPRMGSPEPVEMPTQITPKVTPERLHSPAEPIPVFKGHSQQGSIDSFVMMIPQRNNRVSTRIDNGNTVKSRSISTGSIAPPPNCALPPVPEGKMVVSEEQDMARSPSELSTHYHEMSVLNSPLSFKQPNRQKSASPALASHPPNGRFSGFNFGLNDDNVQVVKVDEESDKVLAARQLTSPTFCVSRQTSPTKSSTSSLNTVDASGWNLPKGFRHMVPQSPAFQRLQGNSRPVSVVSAISLTDENDSASNGQVSRPVSVSSVDLFRQSVVGPNAPALVPESPRSRGHRRQNCIRISGLTPLETSKKRLSSQLDRLAEAEEDCEDGCSLGPSINIEIPTISPARSKTITSPPQEMEAKQKPMNDVPMLRHPQARSLRIKRPGLLNREAVASPSIPDFPPQQGQYELPTPITETPPSRPVNPLKRSKTTEPRFVYAGSPSSDPTKAPAPPQQFSPISPLAVLKKKVPDATNGTPDRLKQLSNQPDPTRTYSPAPTSMLFSSPPQRQDTVVEGSQSPAVNSPRRNKTNVLHGPRSNPAPSLRTRHTVREPRLRQTSEQRSTSPIRKSSQSKPKHNADPHQDDIKRSIALLKNLTYAAENGKGGGIPAVNVVRSSRSPSLGNDSRMMPRTPSSRYADSPALSNEAFDASRPKGTRQRSRTVGGGPANLAPPKLRQESTYPSLNIINDAAKLANSPSNISIWEDASVKADSDVENQTPVDQSKGLREIAIKKQHQRARTAHALFETPSDIPRGNTQVQKESLWKLQQNADVITTRALAYNHNGQTPPKDGKRKTRLDGFWGDKTQSYAQLDAQEQPKPQTTARSRAVSNVMGPRARQRSHTVSSAPRPQFQEFAAKTPEGVGLGVNFGRTGLGTGMNDVVFVNEMARDDIGRLR